MKNNFEMIIGIEVHVVLNTKSKIFSNSLANHNSEVNTNINPIDLGLPGCMPTVNKSCIEKAIILAKGLNMEISNNIKFDRKNYFYQDLPKGFQITQQFNPIAKNGFLQLDDEFKVEIERIHLEEDTAKQIIVNNDILLDYNRAGLPLIEIVTTPCIKSAKQAVSFLKKLRRILIFNNISDAKMEEGSLRADINISTRPIGSNKLGTRSEIKNINSINNIEKAIEFEFDDQIKNLLLNKKTVVCTKKFNGKTNKNEFMRIKTQNVDYHFMVESNIYLRKISNDYIDEVIKKNFVDVNQIENDLKTQNVQIEYINLLLDNFFLYQQYKNFFDKILDSFEVIRWLCIEFIGALNKSGLFFEKIPQEKFDNLIEMIFLLKQNKINGKQAKQIIKFIIETNKDVQTIIKENNFIQITDEKILLPILQDCFNSNKQMLDQYKTRPERVEKFFIGLVMKKTEGQANPDILNDLFKKLLKNIF